jgi:hypothetical protein
LARLDDGPGDHAWEASVDARPWFGGCGDLNPSGGDPTSGSTPARSRVQCVSDGFELHRRIACDFRNLDHYQLRMLLIGGGLTHPHLR